MLYLLTTLGWEGIVSFFFPLLLSFLCRLMEENYRSIQKMLPGLCISAPALAVLFQWLSSYNLAMRAAHIVGFDNYSKHGFEVGGTVEG
jgi:hypothetical protein